MSNNWFEREMPGQWNKFRRPDGVQLWVGVCKIPGPNCANILEHRNGVLTPSGDFKNRAVGKQWVDQLAEIMRGGTFHFTGETIIFSDEGRMINGQQRFTACVKSGVPLETLVVVGVESRVFQVLDQHRRRNVSQVLAIMGESDSPQLASALAVTDGFLRSGAFVIPSGRTRQPDQDMAFLEERPELRYSTAWARKMMRGKGPLPSIGQTASFHYVVSRVDAERCETYLEFLQHGRYSTDQYSEECWVAAKQVRDRLDAARRNRQRLHNLYVSALLIKCWNFHVQARTVGTVKYELEREEHPKLIGWRYEEGRPVEPDLNAYGRAQPEGDLKKLSAAGVILPAAAEA